MKKDIIYKVSKIMQEYPRAKNDDNFLIALVYRNYYGIGTAPFFEVMTNLKGLELPSPESITRARRKLQEEMPLIYGANGKVRKERAKEQEAYRTFYGRF